jgi:hypothetical protein
MTKKVCIIGGGATGVALLWCLAQDADACQEWEVTLIHDQPQLGGHSLAYPVPRNGKTLYIDIGVQFISPMLYPNVHEMLKRPEFKSRVPVFDYDSLKIACSFPPDETGAPLNWGNFPAYQQGDNFALYSPAMADDAKVFEAFIEFSLLTGWGGKTLQSYFDNPPGPFQYQDEQRFINYLLKPYLSIINGYGSALMDETTFGDMFPLFAKLPFVKETPLGSFTQPGKGWQRFTNGASSWVQAMADVAAQTMTPQIILKTKATAVWTDTSANNIVHVTWQGQDGSANEGTFDKVVLTTDMWTNAALLDNDQNNSLWNELYAHYIDKSLWPLMPGKCYIHTDESMLSPYLREEQETLQFNAAYAPGTTDGNYNLSKTFTTYIQKNVLGNPDAEGLYLTMYGYIPDPSAGDKVPDPNKVLFEENWTHGKWTPSFMGGAKKELHLAQGLGNVSYPEQKDSNVYFAGNNTTTDSEEGALDSAMIMADYAFSIQYPLGANPLAFAMYYIYKHEVMFPGQDASSKIAHLHRLLGGREGTITP